MLLHRDVNGGGKLVAAHITEFASVQSAWLWGRSARRRLPTTPGLVFAKAMPFIGSGASAGFGGGLPALRRQVLLTAWREATDFERFLGQPLVQRLATEARDSWWSLFDVVSTRGTHYDTRHALRVCPSVEGAGSGADRRLRRLDRPVSPAWRSCRSGGG